MKKYFAYESQADADALDLFYTEEDAQVDKMYVTVDGFSKFNQKLRDNTIEALYSVVNHIVEKDFDDDRSVVFRDAVESAFRAFDKTSFSDKEIDLIVKYADEFYRAESDVDKIFAQVLSIVNKTPYKCVEIHGAVQRDWGICVCPEDINIEWIEAIVFGTGTMVEVTEEPVEEDEADNAEKICFYSESADPQKIKDLVADYFDVDPNLICYLKIANIKTVYGGRLFEYEQY